MQAETLLELMQAVLVVWRSPAQSGVRRECDLGWAAAAAEEFPAEDPGSARRSRVAKRPGWKARAGQQGKWEWWDCILSFSELPASPLSKWTAMSGDRRNETDEASGEGQEDDNETGERHKRASQVKLGDGALGEPFGQGRKPSSLQGTVGRQRRGAHQSRV